MTLLADVGNTRLKWVQIAGGRIAARGQAAHLGRSLSHVLDCEWLVISRPSAVTVANVAGDAAGESISNWIRSRWKLTPTMIRSGQSEFGLLNAYEHPQTLGVDRWLAMIGGRSLVRGAFGVVDCGTATTIDVVNGEGLHLGGLIMPGVFLMRRCLARSTGDLPEAQGRGSQLLAASTEEAISAGTLHVAVSGVRQFMSQLGDVVESPVSWFLTGGDAPYLLPHLGSKFRHEPDLVLKGLAIAAQCEWPERSDEN